ncbi:MAG: hypothetical protein CL439_00050 [Acidimicrobiaceae bacterium]|nr:hypothetical protein [Acidimicrobiaceae bacterium]
MLRALRGAWSVPCSSCHPRA